MKKNIRNIHQKQVILLYSNFMKLSCLMIDKIEIFINLLYLTKVFELNKKYVYISHLGLNTQTAIFYPFWDNGYRDCIYTFVWVQLFLFL